MRRMAAVLVALAAVATSAHGGDRPSDRVDAQMLPTPSTPATDGGAR